MASLLGRSRSFRRPVGPDEPAPPPLSRNGSLKGRNAKPRDSIDVAKKSQPMHPPPPPPPLPPLPSLERQATSPLVSTSIPDLVRSPNGFQTPPRRPQQLPEGTIPLRRVSYRQKQFIPDGQVVLPGESSSRARSADGRRGLLRRRLSIGRRRSVHENRGMPRARTNSISQPLDEAKVADEVLVKHGRWNILGGLFTKKTAGSAPTSPSNRSRNNSAGEGKESLSSQSSQLVDAPRGLFRGRSKRCGAEARRPSVTRSRTAPIRSEDISKPLPIPGVNWNMRKGSVPLAQAMLDVEIPQVRLERYSVMFGDVLEHNASTPALVADSPPAPPLAKSEVPRPMERTVSEEGRLNERSTG